MQNPQSVEYLVELINVSNNTIACNAAKTLEELSENSNEVYSYFDTFCDLLSDKNSYVRNRAMSLIAANAKWDTDNKTEMIIDEFLTHITDVKPITSRMCIKALIVIGKAKPALKEKIVFALNSADISAYADSMLPLVGKDIQKAVMELTLNS